MFGAHPYNALRSAGMITHTSSSYREGILLSREGAVSPPSSIVEYGFYFYMFYTLIGGVFGLAVNNVATGLLVLLVIFCLAEVGYQAKAILRLLIFPLGCAIIYTFIQLFFFQESLMDTVRPFMIWMCVLFLIQLLTLRENFLHRFMLTMLLIGIAALPYLSFFEEKGLATKRAVLNRAIGFSHTNEMGAWYGFCSTYFLVLGITAKKHITRNLSWIIALGSLYLVTLTVSRGALLAVAVAFVVASRYFLKSGFVPILLFVSLVAIVVGMGLFDETLNFYLARGTEDTGRLAVWPLIVESFLNSPWIGVGHSSVGAMTGRRHLVTPHNGFLYMAQSSGVFPLTLFIAYWLRVGLVAVRADSRSSEAAYYLPLFVYTFIACNLSAFTFTKEWATVALAVPMTEYLRRQTDLEKSGY
jgi:O-antigen ligase